ncbi:hypothetical protein [Bacillus sp. WP8]|uniref:hypothetical protein n=1 Tax=Bacillus sp. WP8 TaxID=756828 RepID=UPI00119EBAA3|nr:hypothetical protein [Bacillus sp. WP8]
MRLELSVVGRGSRGKGFYLEREEDGFLVDGGLRGKEMVEVVGEMEGKGEELEGIFVRDEEWDDIKGVGVMGRK